MNRAKRRHHFFRIRNSVKNFLKHKWWWKGHTVSDEKTVAKRAITKHTCSCMECSGSKYNRSKSKREFNALLCEEV